MKNNIYFGMQSSWLTACISSLVVLVGCATEPGSNGNPEPWDLVEPEPNTTPDHPSRSLLPEHFIDHPTEERQYRRSSTPYLTCANEGIERESYATTIGSFQFWTQFNLRSEDSDAAENFRADFDWKRYNLWLRFPNHSSDWHRFAIDVSVSAEYYWRDALDANQHVRLVDLPLGSRNLWMFELADHCDTLSDEEVIAFRERYGVAEVMYENPATGLVVHFEPSPPLGILQYRVGGQYVSPQTRGGVVLHYQHLINGIEEYVRDCIDCPGAPAGDEMWDEHDWGIQGMENYSSD